MSRICFLFAFLILAFPCSASTITVDNDGPADFDNIQAAIDSAINGDTIIIKPGTYTGAGNQDMDFSGKAIIVCSTDPEVSAIVAATIINCNGSAGSPHRGFYFHSGETANSVLEGLTIINGYADDGAGIYCGGASPAITKCRFVNGTAENWGGGVYCYEASPVISECNFTGNSAREGGAITTYSYWNILCSPLIKNCTMSDNYGSTDGGAFDSDCLSSPIISNCLIINNHSGSLGGGGIAIWQSTPTIQNCVIAGNYTDGWGSGIHQEYDFGDGSKIINCAITGNTGYDNGEYGIFCGSKTFVKNSILWGNTDLLPGDFLLAPGSDVNFAYCDVPNSGGSGLSWNVSMVKDGGGNIDVEPEFADPLNNDYHLQSAAGRWDPNSKRWVRDLMTSHCIDAGDPNSDWRAELWPHGKRINMGAYGGTAEASMSLSALGNIANLDNDPEEIVDIFDIAIFASQWCLRNMPLSADIDRNGRVDFIDFAMLGQIFTVNIGIAKNPQPSNGQQSVSTHPVLIWSTGTHVISNNVYFGSNFAEVSNGNVTDHHVYMGNQDVNYWNTNNYSPAGLDFYTTYYWRIDEVGDTTIAKGNVWSFTTIVQLPGQARNPTPGNGTTGVSITTDLSWTAGSYATSHDVYFGTTNPPQFRINQIGATYDTGTMLTNTTYYWRIDEKNTSGTTIGDVWSFTTAVILPGQASNPTPANGGTAVVITTDLSWTAGSLATSHDVYFGTTNPPQFLGNQTGTIYDTVIMDTNTTYYWQIDEKNASGTTTGILWSFTTGEPNIALGLAAWWKFDEGTGTIAHDFAGTNNGTIYGATWTTGKIAGALSFNGTSNYVDCGSGPSNYDNITVSAWMQTSTFGTLVSNRYQSYSYGTWYTLSSTTIEIGDNSQGGYRNLTFNTPTLDGLWHHVVYTKNGTSHAIYVDGSLDQSFTSNADISQNVPLYIGQKIYRTSGNVWFNGIIDDVRIYNRALGASEIELLYKSCLNAFNPNPINGTTDISPNAILSWNSGMDAVTHDVYFGTDYNDVNGAIHGSGEYMGNKDVNHWDTNGYAPAGLNYSTTYYWRIDEVNATSTTKGDIWSFTTVPPPPGQASNPTPDNGATGVSRTTDLSWTASSNATSHDVYFGTTNPPQFRSNQTGTTYDTGTMDTNTTYYWRIDEKNAGGTTTGELWSFTTIIQLPGQASNPTPSNGATNTGLAVNLSWTVGSDATSHNVYFGTTNPPPFRINQTGTNYDTGLRDTNTTYYWQIDEKNTSGITTGILWSFTTGSGDVNNSGLVAWWKFDEGTGIIAYDSAGSNNGTVSGATWTAGKFAGALNFNGTSNYVDCGSGASNYDNITVSAWMKTSTQGTLVSNRYNSGSYGTWYTLFSNVIEIGDNTNGGYKYLTFNSATLDGAWHHIVYTKNGTSHAVYVDGSLDQQFTSNADISWNKPLYIGKRLIAYFGGVIDDVRVYNRALSAGEVAQLYEEAN